MQRVDGGTEVAHLDATVLSMYVGSSYMTTKNVKRKRSTTGSRLLVLLEESPPRGSVTGCGALALQGAMDRCSSSLL